MFKCFSVPVLSVAAIRMAKMVCHSKTLLIGCKEKQGLQRPLARHLNTSSFIPILTVTVGTVSIVVGTVKMPQNMVNKNPWLPADCLYTYTPKDRLSRRQYKLIILNLKEKRAEAQFQTAQDTFLKSEAIVTPVIQ